MSVSFSDKEEGVSTEIPIRAEEIGFRPEQMVRCDKCGRTNGPDRVKCLYCGGELPVSEARADVKLHLRQLEDWENGKNVILLPTETASLSVAEIARFLSINETVVERIFELRYPMPIARVELDREVDVIKARLADHRLNCIVVADENLASDQPSVRLRGIEFGLSSINLEPFNAGMRAELPVEELALIVRGTIFQSRTETLEERKRHKTALFTESQSTSDEQVIDLYSKSDPIGWRIRSGFDFSCLGHEKDMVAAENISRLAERLGKIAPDAKLNDEYNLCRSMLDEIWPPEIQKESLGVQKATLNRKELKKAVVTSNLTQFTKFSRLQWHLL
jgi:hypothetical protein